MDKTKLKDSLREMEGIIKWFDAQEEVDVEVGLDKVKQGIALIRASKGRLKELENEFETMKRELKNENETIAE